MNGGNKKKDKELLSLFFFSPSIFTISALYIVRNKKKQEL